MTVTEKPAFPTLWGWLAVAILVSGVVMVVGPFRFGGYLLAAIFVLFGVLRIAGPRELRPSLSLRGPIFDLACFWVAAAAVAVAVTLVKL